MKAVRMYAPGDLRVEEVQKPSPEADEVLIKVEAVGVCGSDIPRANVYGAHVSPITLGHEFSGTIEELGSGVEGLQTGDPVVVAPLIPCYACTWCKQGAYSLCENYDYYGSRRDGAMAEYVAVKQGNVLKLPAGVSFEDAATIDPCANAMHALACAGFTGKETLTVYGMGAIGMYILQCAKAMGAPFVACVDIWDEKLAICHELGADLVVDSRTQTADAAVREKTDGRGTAIAIDCTGAPPAQLNAIRTVDKHGTVVLLGISHKGLNLTDKDVDAIMRGELTVRGSWNSFGMPFPGPDWTGAIDLMAKKAISAEKLISHRLPLDEVPATFRRIAEGNYYFNKILFFPSGKTHS